MAPTTITAGRGDTSHLRGQNRDTSGMVVSPDAARVRQSSVAASTALPFTRTGWDADQILRHLGQYDRIPGTDSDAFRCVQTVALTSHILNGISATKGYLASIKLQGMLEGGYSHRTRSAIQAIDHAIYQIETKNATYGDLYWVIEAVHAMFNADDRGTPEGDIREQISPMLDMSAEMHAMDEWCNNPAEIMQQAQTLQNGEQFMLNKWSVSFNTTFSAIPGREEAQTAVFDRVDEDTGRVTRHRIRRLRIRPGQKPAHTRIDENRDSKRGHQMLMYKDNATGHIKMYDPELRQGGRHLYDLTADSSVLNTLFNDQPDFEMYGYVQILGKMTPSTFLSGFGSSP